LNRATGGFGLVTTGIGLAVAAALLTSGRAAVPVTTLSTRTPLTVLLWWGVTAVALTAAFAQMLTLARVARLGETMTQADDARAAQDRLRVALADPAALLYPADGHGSFRDAHGREVPPPGPTRQQTVLSRGGVPVAVLDHAPGIAPDSLRRRLGPSVLLALHNDSLRRQLETQVTELTASRRRVVAQADATRAALERDLHDGAQQRVLALRIATSQGQSAATARGEVHVADAFQEAGRAAQQALEGLRALASGIHPAILEGAGLSAALQHLADSNPTPFILEAGSLPMIPRDLQRTTFAIVRDAARYGVSRVSVSCDTGDLHLGVATSAGITDTVRDRVAAAGGTLRERTDGWEARLPCE
jgi:signal transduction histidine kinase